MTVGKRWKKKSIFFSAKEERSCETYKISKQSFLYFKVIGFVFIISCERVPRSLILMRFAGNQVEFSEILDHIKIAL